MALTSFTGPLIVPGNIDSTRGGLNDNGASLFGDGTGVIDPRQLTLVGAAVSGSPVAGFYDNNVFTALDCYPQVNAPANLASQAAGLVIPSTGTVSIPLAVTNGPATAANVPLVPLVTTRNAAGLALSTTYQAFNAQNQVLVTALDFGPCQVTLPATATTTATPLTSNVTSPGGTYPAYQSGVSFPANQILTLSAQSVTNWNTPEKFFYPGQKVIVSGAGNAAGTLCLVANVLAIDYVQHFVVIDRPVLNTVAVTGVGVGIGFADPLSLTTAYPWQAYDRVATFDASASTSRTLAVTTLGADVGITIQINGYDMYGVPMTEQITTVSTGTAVGLKAFKYVSSITASKAGGTTTANTIQVGTGLAAAQPTFGFPIRVEQFEYIVAYYNGALVTANTGFTRALTLASSPVPIVAGTADVRGTYQPQTTAPNGAIKLSVYIDAQQYTNLVANSQQTSYFYGNTQS
jgi:hypothetical protein